MEAQQPGDYAMDLKEKILRGGQVAISICGIISVEAGRHCIPYGVYSFYMATAILSMIMSFFLLLFSFLNMEETFRKMGKVQLIIVIFDIIWTSFYLLSAILVFANRSCDEGSGGRIMAGIFGLFGLSVCGVLAYFGVLGSRSRFEEREPVTQPSPA